MLSVTIQDLGDVSSVGRIVAGREADILREAALSQSKARTVVLDLAQVEAIDGGGIGVLVFLQASRHAAGMELKLMNPTQHVVEMLKVNNLDSLFAIFPSVYVALCNE